MSDKDKKKKSKKSEKKKSKTAEKPAAKAAKKKPAVKKAASAGAEKPAAKAKPAKKKPAKKASRKPAAKKTAKKPARKKPAAKLVDAAEEGPLGSNTVRVASAARAAAEAMKGTSKPAPKPEARNPPPQAPAYTRQDIEMEAYLIAERDGFVNDSSHYWHLAVEALKNRR